MYQLNLFNFKTHLMSLFQLPIQSIFLIYLYLFQLSIMNDAHSKEQNHLKIFNDLLEEQELADSLKKDLLLPILNLNNQPNENGDSNLKTLEGWPLADQIKINNDTLNFQSQSYIRFHKIKNTLFRISSLQYIDHHRNGDGNFLPTKQEMIRQITDAFHIQKTKEYNINTISVSEFFWKEGNRVIRLAINESSSDHSQFSLSFTREAYYEVVKNELLLLEENLLKKSDTLKKSNNFITIKNSFKNFLFNMAFADGGVEVVPPDTGEIPGFGDFTRAANNVSNSINGLSNSLGQFTDIGTMAAVGFATGGMAVAGAAVANLAISGIKSVSQKLYALIHEKITHAKSREEMFQNYKEAVKLYSKLMSKTNQVELAIDAMTSDAYSLYDSSNKANDNDLVTYKENSKLNNIIEKIISTFNSSQRGIKIDFKSFKATPSRDSLLSIVDNTDQLLKVYENILSRNYKNVAPKFEINKSNTFNKEEYKNLLMCFKYYEQKHTQASDQDLLKLNSSQNFQKCSNFILSIYTKNNSLINQILPNTVLDVKKPLTLSEAKINDGISEIYRSRSNLLLKLKRSNIKLNELENNPNTTSTMYESEMCTYDQTRSKLKGIQTILHEVDKSGISNKNICDYLLETLEARARLEKELEMLRTEILFNEEGYLRYELRSRRDVEKKKSKILEKKIASSKMQLYKSDEARNMEIKRFLLQRDQETSACFENYNTISGYSKNVILQKIKSTINELGHTNNNDKIQAWYQNPFRLKTSYIKLLCQLEYERDTLKLLNAREYQKRRIEEIEALWNKKIEEQRKVLFQANQDLIKNRSKNFVSDASKIDDLLLLVKRDHDQYFVHNNEQSNWFGKNGIHQKSKLLNDLCKKVDENRARTTTNISIDRI